MDKIGSFAFGVLGSLLLMWLLGDSAEPLEAASDATTLERVLICEANNMSAASTAVTMTAEDVVANGTVRKPLIPTRTDCFAGLSDEETEAIVDSHEFAMMRQHFYSTMNDLVKPFGVGF